VEGGKIVDQSGNVRKRVMGEKRKRKRRGA
jgi:hypothetical protein